jgi:hypothetical protein
MNRVVNSTLLTLVLLIPASVSAQSNVGVYVTGPDLQTKELEFKVVEGQRVKSGFQVKPESVVQVTQDGNLLVVTEPRNNVDNVKITDGSGKTTELVNTNGDTHSLSGIAPGVYTLDVIVNQPNSNNRAAYETILVILQPGQAPQNPTQIIQKVKVVTDVSITFEDDDGKDRDRDRDPCKRWKSYGDVCQPIRNGQCEQGYVKLFGACFDTDAILDHETEEECQADPLCREYRERYPSDPDCGEGFVFERNRCIPICGEGQYEPGELCRDDGDEDEVRCPDGSIIIPSIGEECPPEEDDRDLSNPVCPPRCGNNEDLPPVEEEPIEEEGDSDEGNNDDGGNDNGDNGDNSNEDSNNSGETFE